MQKCIFDKIEEWRIGLRLFQASLQQLDHEQADRIFKYIEKDILIEMPPFEFFYPLQVLQIIVINNQVEHGAGLKQVSPSCTLFRRNPDTIDEV